MMVYSTRDCRLSAKTEIRAYRFQTWLSSRGTFGYLYRSFAYRSPGIVGRTGQS